MPAPNQLGGANTAVYDLAGALVAASRAWLCPIGPNAVTCAAALSSLGVAYGVYRRGCWITTLALAFLREFLDILDGVVARSCKETSRMGAILDVVGDTIAVCAVGTATAVRLYPSLRPLALLAYAIVGAALVAMGKDLTNTITERPRPAMQTIMGRNSILGGPILVAMLKLIAHSRYAR
tara:strand:+ start:230 stop:769 length:540 start_codon:yes stop_codon:yes gene_type:complete